MIKAIKNLFNRFFGKKKPEPMIKRFNSVGNIEVINPKK